MRESTLEFDAYKYFDKCLKGFISGKKSLNAIEIKHSDGSKSIIPFEALLKVIYTDLMSRPSEASIVETNRIGKKIEEVLLFLKSENKIDHDYWYLLTSYLDEFHFLNQYLTMILTGIDTHFNFILNHILTLTEMVPKPNALEYLKWLKTQCSTGFNNKKGELEFRREIRGIEADIKQWIKNNPEKYKNEQKYLLDNSSFYKKQILTEICNGKHFKLGKIEKLFDDLSDNLAHGKWLDCSFEDFHNVISGHNNKPIRWFGGKPNLIYLLERMFEMKIIDFTYIQNKNPVYKIIESGKYFVDPTDSIFKIVSKSKSKSRLRNQNDKILIDLFLSNFAI